MKEKILLFTVRMAGWAMGAKKIIIAEQLWHAQANAIKGHRLDVVFARACVAFRRSK